MEKTNWNLYNLPNDEQLNICEKFIKYFGYFRFTYWNYDNIIFYKKRIQEEDEIIKYFDDDEDFWICEKGYVHISEININLEDAYNLLKPYIRKEKLNKILNEKN